MTIVDWRITMKLQSASFKEIKRITVGSAICLVGMLLAFFGLSAAGIGNFDFRVVLGGVVGTMVAVANFAALCLTIQSAAGITDKNQMQTRFRISYHIRLAVQTGWVVAAFLLPCFHAVAAALPLLFPNLVVYYLHITGGLTSAGQQTGRADCEK